MKKIITFILILNFISCNKSEKNETNINLDLTQNQSEIITMNSISQDYDSIINRVKVYGDKEAYSELFYHLKDTNFEGRTDTLMFYSKIMALKFNYEKAYIDYLDAVTEKYKIEKNIDDYSTINLSNLKTTEKNEIIEWLKIMLENKIISNIQYDEVIK